MSVVSSAALAYSAQPKLSTLVLSPMATREDLSKAYTPGIAEVCKLIEEDPSAIYTHTFRRNSLAVISDGSAVLGLGNIGPQAGYPVMEGKAMLFKRFADIDAIPIVVDTQDTAEFISTVKNIARSFAAINLEDIAAPRCFEIEQRLVEALDMPVMHDDQHGTAVVLLAAVLNALQLEPHQGKDSKIVMIGAGAAGSAIAHMLLDYGFHNLTMVDSQGAIYRQRPALSDEKLQLAAVTNPEQLSGSLADVIKGADIFIGVSKPGVLTANMIRTMSAQPIVIAMANPVPEILPDEAMAAGVGVMATGRSDFANQVNNALAFPGIFRAAINAHVRISSKMKLAAAEAIVEYHQSQLTHENLMPSILDEKVHHFIAEKVALVC